MPHFTSAVEYGLHCLLFLVEHPPDRPAPSTRDLAELQCVPVPYLAKIFTKLQKAGLVEAAQGIRGGFRLARAARQISVLDIVDAIEGSKPLFDCRQIRTRCAIFEDQPPAWASEGICAIHAVMLQAEQKMRAALAAHTLADLAQRLSTKAPPAFEEEILTWLDERAAGRRRRRTPPKT